MTRKLISIGLSAIFMLLTLAGCAGNKDNTANTTVDNDSSKKLNIVCTTFPQYDWVRRILGEKAGDAKLTMLLDSGVDLHSYQPTAADIITVSSCDLFVYVGGISDKWADDAISAASNDKMETIDMMKVLGDSVKEEETVAGMQAEEEEHDESGEPEYDEHVWLSLRNAVKICGAIKDALIRIDADNSSVYETNYNNYIKELEALDGEYSSAVQSAKRQVILFGDRFPFRYLVDDYSLEYYAAFVGCSAESEASFKTVVFLAGKAEELSLPAVLVTESSDKSIAKTIINNTGSKNQKILVMNAMQTITASNITDGVSYLSIMRDNLEVLKEALN